MTKTCPICWIPTRVIALTGELVAHFPVVNQSTGESLRLADRFGWHGHERVNPNVTCPGSWCDADSPRRPLVDF